MSFSITGKPTSFFLTYFLKLSSIDIEWTVGASLTLVAGLGLAFLTITLSPILTSAFLRSVPSILIMSRPRSSGREGQTIAAVFLLPSISTTSPASTPSSFITSGSIRTLFLPASLGLASETLNTTSFGVFEVGCCVGSDTKGCTPEEL